MQRMTPEFQRLATLTALLLTAGTACPQRAAAQSASGDPRETEQWTPVPPVVSPGAAGLNVRPDLMMLIDRI
jgi:hypothetical protein